MNSCTTGVNARCFFQATIHSVSIGGFNGKNLIPCEFQSVPAPFIANAFATLLSTNGIILKIRLYVPMILIFLKYFPYHASNIC